jgi:hypothetical protein
VASTGTMTPSGEPRDEAPSPNGLGVTLLQMRTPAAARALVPVAQKGGTR